MSIQGGGDQYFQEPPSFSIETLTKYATFASKLRSTDSIKGKAIQEAVLLAKAVGNTEASFELVVGLLFRHVKTWKGVKQLAGWYVLHQLCRDEPDKYAHEANKYILEVGCDCIPWENAELSPKYDMLVQKWNAERLFSEEVVRRIWQSKADRAEQVKFPARYAAELKEEEAVWREEELRLQGGGREAAGVGSGQACHDYLQGNCTWGNACRLLHPPGLQGTLPPECRLGDWKCACGSINRHFRRRCSTCPKEKPQYHRSLQKSEEDRLLSQPEDNSAVFRHQFGYDPNNAEEAVRFWAQRLASYSTQRWREERSDAYRTKILMHHGGGRDGGEGANAAASSATTAAASASSLSSSSLNFTATAIAEDVVPDEIVPATKRHRVEGQARLAAAARQQEMVAASQRVHMPALPSLSPADRIPFISRRIIDSGIQDPCLGELLYLLTVSIRDVASLRGGLAANVPSPTHFEPFYTVAALVYAGWNTNKCRGIAKIFFADIRPYLSPFQQPATTTSASPDGLVGNTTTASAVTSSNLPEELHGQMVDVLSADQIANLKAMAKDVTEAN